MVGQTEPGQTAGLAAGSPQAAHDSSRQAGAFPGQSSGPRRRDRGRRRRQRRWNGTRCEAVEFHGPVHDDGGHEDVVVSETVTDSGVIDLDAPQEWNVEPEETQTVPDMALSAPRVDAEQLDLSDDAASDTCASIQESCPNVEIPDAWSADHLAEIQKAAPEIGIIYRWSEERKVPSRDDVLRHGAGVKGYAAQWKSLVLIHNVVYRLF